jgi:hypothetical protein
MRSFDSEVAEKPAMSSFESEIGETARWFASPRFEAPAVHRAVLAHWASRCCWGSASACHHGPWELLAARSART